MRVLVPALVIGALACSPIDEPSFEGASPASQASIVTQHIFGDERSQSWLYEIEDDGAGGLYFLGRLDGRAMAGRMSTDGTIMWTVPLDGRTPDILRVPAASGVLQDALLLVGEDESEEEGYTGAGVVKLVDRDGTVLRDLSLPGTGGAGRRLNSVALTTTSAPYECIVVGGEVAAGTAAPYVVGLSLSNADTLRVTGETTLNDSPGRVFYRVLPITGQARVEYVVIADIHRGHKFVESEGLWKLDDRLQVVWTADVTPSGANAPSLNNLLLQDGNVIACGSAERSSADGWTAALLASVAVDGRHNWVDAIELSAQDDSFWAFFLYGGDVYAVSLSAARWVLSTNRLYGLAGVHRLDLTRGMALQSWTFGSSSYRSSFFSAVVSGTRVFCAGTTRHAVSRVFYQGWLVEVDVGLPSPVNAPHASSGVPSRLRRPQPPG